MPTLFLTTDEQQAFKSLSPELREGWEVEAESLHFEDTPQKRRIRMSIMRVQDPWAKELADRVVNANSDEEFAAVVDGIDLKNIPNDDLTEIFFGLGPDSLSWPIGALLLGAKTDDDIQAAESLSAIRHQLLEQFCGVPA